MGFLDLIKDSLYSITGAEIMPPIPNAQTIYFSNGSMYKVIPTDEESWYDARFLVSDGKLFDLESVADIQSIPVPAFVISDSTMKGYGITGRLDYVLRMKAAHLHKPDTKDLFSACMWKAVELMVEAGGWQPKDYDRLVNWHSELGMFEETKKARAYLIAHGITTQKKYLHDMFEQTAWITKVRIIDESEALGIDLIAAQDLGNGCCPMCASMRGRVYSISGRNKKFPKLPTRAREHGNFHAGCSCILRPYMESEKTVLYKGEQVDAVRSSRRPKKDDRTQEEVEQYINRIVSIEKQDEERQRQAERSLRKGIDVLEFETIQHYLPTIAPKNVTEYTQIKKAKSEYFLKLKAVAERIGIIITEF